MPAPGTFRLRRTTTWVRLAPNESQENIMGKADMFTFDETPVKFIGLLILLSWCTIWCLYGLTGSRGARQRVCDVLHLAMAVVMLAMVPKGVWMALTGVVAVPMIVAVFAAATLWFAWLTFGTLGQSRRHGGAHRGHGLHHAGHTAMFAAMTWHLTAMAVKASARAELGMGPAMREWMEQAGRPGRVLWVFALVGLPFMAYLLVAGALALWRTGRRRRSPSRRPVRLRDELRHVLDEHGAAHPHPALLRGAGVLTALATAEGAWSLPDGAVLPGPVAHLALLRSFTPRYASFSRTVKGQKA